MLGAWRGSGNFGVVVSSSSSSSALSSGRPWLSWPWSPRGRGRCGQHRTCPGCAQVAAAQIRAPGREQMPGDTEPSLRALVAVGQGDLLLFFKASWDAHPTGHQKPGRNLDLTAGPSPLVPCGCDKDQSPERQDLVEWGHSLFASVGLGIM